MLLGIDTGDAQYVLFACPVAAVVAVAGVLAYRVKKRDKPSDPG